MTDQSAHQTPEHAEAALKLEDFLPHRLNVCSNLVSQALSRIYAERYKIGIPEWRVLVTLGQFGLMTAKAIGAHTCMHKTKVSRAVSLLEHRKLVELEGVRGQDVGQGNQALRDCRLVRQKRACDFAYAETSDGLQA